MKRGDLLKVTRLTRASIRYRNFRILGILLEEPIFPRYGNYPMRYKVLTPEGSVQTIIEKYGYTIEPL